jgi:hypothetical protein
MKNLSLKTTYSKIDYVEHHNNLNRLGLAIKHSLDLPYPSYTAQMRNDMKAQRALMKTQGQKTYLVQAKVAGKPHKYFCANRKSALDTIKGWKRQEKETRRARKALNQSSVTRKLCGTYVNISYTRGVRTTPGYFLQIKDRVKAKKCFDVKTPTTPEKHLGIELEFCIPVPVKDVALALAKADLQNNVTLKSDGSLRARPGEYAIEANILVAESDSHRVVKAVCSVLNSLGAYVNETCGMHVHLDMRNRDLKKCYEQLFQAQKFLIETQPPNRREGEYCKKQEYPTFAQAKAAGARYRVINAAAFDSHKTLEIRSHSGTTDANKVLQWTGLLTGLVNSDYIGEKPFTSLKTLAYRANLSEESTEYFWERMEKFKVYYNDNENTEDNVVIVNGSQRLYKKALLTIEEKEKAKPSDLQSTSGMSSNLGDSNVF